MKKIIVYFDMDGVMANFAKGAGTEPGIWSDDPPAMFKQGFFRNLEVMPGAKEGMAKLLAMEHLDIWIASKPTSKNLHCASEKLFWVEEHFPELLKKTFLITEKGHLNGDYLVDDLLDWKDKFQGNFIHFDERTPINDWEFIVNYFSTLK